MADLLLGVPANGDIQVIDGTRGFRRTELGFYFQDDFKVTPKLTLNLGARYELFPNYPWTEVNDRQTLSVKLDSS
ncbi:MAG: TonB-dependent receptor [Acidobacteria bacterium]|nr:TonB-dependent receptor [Acidobacteriota bacterium]MCI0721194.1 TonB-dependent receptor [Acidobacteriota bacterium]